MKRVRIVLVAPLPPPMGGIAAWTRRVLDYAETSSEVDICHVDSAVRNRPIHEVGFWSRIRAGLFQGPALIRDVFLTLRRERPDLLHLTTSGSFGAVRDLAILLAAVSFQVPATYQLRFGRLPEIVESGNWEWLILRLNFHLASATWVLDQRSFSVLSQACPTVNVHKVPNPVPSDLLDHQLRKEGTLQQLNLTGEQYVLFAGRATRSKGIEDLLRAWVSMKTTNWKLVIAGPCSDPFFADLLNEIGPAVNTLIVGELEQSELLEVMAECSIFVLPSHTEGFPNAILEAMTLGRAVVASDVGAVDEMLSGGAGFVVPPHDPTKLAQALTQAMAEPDTRRRLGDRAKESVRERYALPRVFSQYAALWQATCSRRNSK